MMHLDGDVLLAGGTRNAVKSKGVRQLALHVDLITKVLSRRPRDNC